MLGLAHKLYLLNSDVVPIKTDSLNKYCMKGFHDRDGSWHRALSHDRKACRI